MKMRKKNLFAVMIIIPVIISSCSKDDDETIAIGEAIDLGLSVKWASWNVGASRPEESGGYYAWGETKEKNEYSWDSYAYCKSDKNLNRTDVTINITNICGSSYDVAHVKWGGSWRLPTKSEIGELVNKCTWKWTSYNGVKGQLVTGPNGNSIFLPFASYRYKSDPINKGSNGFYWSGTNGRNYRLDTAYYMEIGNSSRSATSCQPLYLGLSVRPVKN